MGDASSQRGADALTASVPASAQTRRSSKLRHYYLRQNRSAYLMILVPLFIYLAFKYVPMFGVVIALQDYNPWLGFLESPFVGFKHFELFVTGPYFVRIMRNMLVLNLLLLVFAFPAPIIFALLLNELGVGPFKKITQTISYLPHFISTVVIVGIMMKMFSYSGVVNKFVVDFGGEALPFFSLPGAFRPLYVGSDIWQGVGWGSIVYLAAIAGINPELYEAATIDGASRLQKALYITIPSLLPTIMILFILRVGDLLELGFEKIFLMYNPSTYEVADVVATYVYRRGIENLNYSYATAVGLFNAVLSFFLLIGANRLSRKLTEYSLW